MDSLFNLLRRWKWKQQIEVFPSWGDHVGHNDVCNPYFSEFKSVSSASIITWCTCCVYARRMWSSQKVAANHKSIPPRTVNHWQAICSLGLNVPGDKDAAFCQSSFRLQLNLQITKADILLKKLKNGVLAWSPLCSLFILLEINPLKTT